MKKKELEKQLLELQLAALDVCKSFECYSALKKPESEWDEYDYLMYPKWIALTKLLNLSLSENEKMLEV